MNENLLLYYIYQNNEKALKCLFEMHEKNIYFCVKNTLDKCNYTCMYTDEFVELIHIAEIELYQAVFNYKDDGRNTFQTFAMKCIEMKIKQEIRKKRSNANSLLSNALRLDDKVQDGETMYYVDMLKNPHAEFEGVFCMDIRNPKVIYEMLQEKFDEKHISILFLKRSGLSYDEIGIRLGMGSKHVGYIYKKMIKFLNDTLTKKM